MSIRNHQRMAPCCASRQSALTIAEDELRGLAKRCANKAAKGGGSLLEKHKVLLADRKKAVLLAREAAAQHARECDLLAG